MKVTEYKCGHKSDGVIIIDSNLLSISAYLTWTESVGLEGDRSECWDCYCKGGRKWD